MATIELLFLNYLLPTILVVLSWSRWFRSQRPATRKWRDVILLIGLLASATNLLIFYTWVVYSRFDGSPVRVWSINNSAGTVAEYFLLAALVGAVVGRGAGRILLAFAALTGVLVWVPPLFF